MRTRAKLFILLLCLTVMAALVGLLSHNPEPRYHGRSLSEWHALWSKSVEYDDLENRAQAEQAANAIRAIGTNALPILLKGLRQYPSVTRLHFEKFVSEKLPGWISESAIARHLLSRKKAVEPTSTFVILGPIASPAVPELAGLLCTTNISRDISRSAAYCLVAIGKDGLPPLLAALAKPQLPCSYLAADILSIVPLTGPHFDLGTNVAQAVPLLATNARSKDTELARVSIKALGHLRKSPTIAIPALVQSLDSTDFYCRSEGVRSLARFGPEAVQPLRDALNHPDINVRTAATNHLRNLAPQYLTNAPAH